MPTPSLGRRGGRPRCNRLFVSLLLLCLPACAALHLGDLDLRPPPVPVAVDPEGCNGDRALCGRRFDEVAYATTHNAFSSYDAGFWAANQRVGLTRQLEDGVRALMLDSHYPRWDRSTPWLCHKTCWAGGMPLHEGLGEVARFLARRPREVVTLILESHVTAPDTRAAFARAGLLDLLHVQPPGAPWPTLGAMIASGRRVVVLTDRGGDAFPGLLAQWRHAFETPFAVWREDGFECGVHRGDGRHPLFVLNHFVSSPLPDRQASTRVNRAEPLREHVRRCTRERGRQPNFVTVDHYDAGDVLTVVAELNGTASAQRAPKPFATVVALAGQTRP